MRFEGRIVLTAYFLFEYKTPVLPETCKSSSLKKECCYNRECVSGAIILLTFKAYYPNY